MSRGLNLTDDQFDAVGADASFPRHKGLLEELLKRDDPLPGPAPEGALLAAVRTSAVRAPPPRRRKFQVGRRKPGVS